jgi:pimeloyl-ACP methyl ester carboxylesterase
MVDRPRTRYAKAPGGDVAYQVLGAGPVDVVMVPGWFSHLDILWDEPKWRAFVGELTSFARVILYDKRGTGLSDPVDSAPTIESRVDDLLAVFDAAGVEHATLFGYSEGGPISLVFAATYPERVTSLVMFGTGLAPDDDSVRARLGNLLTRLRASVDDWGEGRTLDWAAPSIRDDVAARNRMGAFERAAMSPRMALLTWQAVTQLPDLHAIAETISVPTLVLHRRNEAMPVEMGREVSNAIPGARFVELEGVDHLIYLGDYKVVVGEMEEFLTGQRHRHPPDRVLSTVLFTDIVDSTRRAADIGDQRWRELLQRHDEIAHAEIASYNGRFVKHTGDGLLATFDGPTRAVLCAITLAERMPQIGLEVRGGLHTGECIRRDEDIGGIAVHIAARIAAHAGAKEVLVSSTVKDLVYGSGITFENRGAVTLKGVPGDWQLHAPTGYHDPVENALSAAAQV